MQELKHKGYPQEVKGGHLVKLDAADNEKYHINESIYYPTLNELIIECGLSKEAIARLWLDKQWTN